MEPLLVSDPSRIAEYRLLGRLGAGGMGTVYLGRGPDGRLAAVKVIRAEYATDPAYRARFRREAAAAAQVRSPYVVPVVGSDPEAECPWLAAEFVPGLSLSEAVAGYGALPVSAVRVLGRVLARALAAVHAAGLVHRDVKPGNVLLAVAGPRLIDFGIARATGAAALTATGAVLGTPGFLAPEQARGRSATPAGDVFSLGCLLVYAATGRPPFGGGAVDAVLYRTVYDEPDVDWAALGDAELGGLLRACLAKDPADRPTAAALDVALAPAALRPPAPGSGPGSASDSAPALDPPPALDPAPARAPEGGPAPRPGHGPGGHPGRREDRWPEDRRPEDRRPEDRWPEDRWPEGSPGRPGGARGGPPAHAAGWLPDAVVAAIGARSSELLALPDVTDTVLDDLGRTRAGSRRGSRPDARPDSWPGPRADSRPGDRAAVGRRRFLLRVGGLGALVAASGGGTATWLAVRRGPGPARPSTRRWVIGVHADLTGPQRELGRAQERGVRLAVAAFNSVAARPFSLAVAVADDAGDPRRAPSAAARLVGDPDVLAVVGPTGDASVLAALDRYSRAGLALVTVSAAGTAYGAADRRALLQTCPVAAAHADAIDLRLVVVEGVRRLGVLCDRSGRSAAWETAFLADLIVDYDEPDASAYPRVAPRGLPSLRPVVADMLGRGLDGFLYTGTPAGAAETARLLAAARFGGPRAADYPVMGAEFVRLAGPAAEGWQFLAPCVGPDAPAAARAAAAHRARYGTPPALWTAEAYEATLLVADRLLRLAAARRGRPGRAELLAGLARGTYRGRLKEYAFDGDGRIKDVTSHLHRVAGGRIRYVGPAPVRAVATGRG
ncbi:bifunctional serine/threonine-protein kinase/ABC transporter substrate-binding protein [Streptomyces sp. NRRL S-87]|uniref:bifunctional serine/threonine-protein kinase/ABC transporter substrate-binding protein n=1 Tax=Streptomyces sp. NRRL S-87 TaxID=1463920 RepID=UPI0005633872|nr:bifunctional serine/threonine-protein kinase/ABC transporter substrate-binding protein [Streptomyces sp. NRRL S-87]